MVCTALALFSAFVHNTTLSFFLNFATTRSYRAWLTAVGHACTVWSCDSGEYIKVNLTESHKPLLATGLPCLC